MPSASPMPLSWSWRLVKVGSQTILAPMRSAVSTAAGLTPPTSRSQQMPPNTRTPSTTRSTMAASGAVGYSCDFNTRAACPAAAASPAASSSSTERSRSASGPKWQCRSAAPVRSTLAGTSVLETEADLHRHLEVPDVRAVDPAPHLRHLEPVEVAQRLAGARDTVANRLLEAVGGGSDDLGHSVRVVWVRGHRASRRFGTEGSHATPVRCTGAPTPRRRRGRRRRAARREAALRATPARRGHAHSGVPTGVSDLELAVAAEARLVDRSTVVVTTVHELQVRPAGAIPPRPTTSTSTSS